MKSNPWFTILKTTAINWWDDNALRLAASLSYYMALSIAPLLVIVIAIAGGVFGRSAVAEQLGNQFGNLMGEDGKRIVNMIVEHADQPHRGVVAGTLGIVLLIFGATAVFGELQSAMNLIWKVESKPGATILQDVWAWLRQRFLSLTMVMAVAFMLLISLVLSAGMAALSSHVHGGDHARVVAAQVVNQLVTLPLLVLVFALLFKFIPDVHVRWREVWVGALASATLFMLGKYAIGIYLGQAGVGSAYGAAGSLVVLLAWVYYSSLIFFFGAEFTQAHASQRRGSRTKAGTRKTG